MNNPNDDFLKSLDDIPPLAPPIQKGPWPPYSPSNGSEGCIFEAKFCDRCAHEDIETERWCDIHTNALFYYTNQEGFPAEYWVYFNGEPTCLAFKDRDDGLNGRAPIPFDDPAQLDMFLELPVVEVAQ